jgi:putative ABC transport system permease protein
VNIRETLMFAITGVLANKLRSLLTMSGIFIGVAAVIILISAGTGANKQITDNITALGANTLTITPNATTGGGRGGGGGGAGAFRGGGGGGGGFGGGAGAGRNAAGANTGVQTGTQIQKPQLTLDDAEALVDPELAPDVGLVAPAVAVSSVNATYNGATHAVQTFTGTTPSYLTINNDTVQAGTLLSDSDYTGHRRVALLGPTVAIDLIGGNGLAIVGQTVQFNGVSYQVVGVLTAKGSQGTQDRDDLVIAPLTSVQDTLAAYGTLSSIAAEATTAQQVDAAQSEVTQILISRHHVTAATADFTVNNPSSILDTVNTVTGIFTLLLGGVAGISLFVGGIGVMNIMLVTVTERTREIGIRKAIGAQRSAIVGQFLLEAVLLSLAGGIIGVVIGVLVSQLKIGTFQLVVAPYSIVLAFAVSVAIGLFFGWYPANRAASLRPIDALRYE